MTRYYKQCLFDGKCGNYKCTKITWIPEEFAHVGKIVKFKIQDDMWSDGWIVREVYTRLEEDKVIENSRDYLRTRAASDI